MSSVRKYFRMDKAAEERGIWVDIDGTKFKVARAGGANKAFAKLLEKLTRPHRRAIQMEVLSPEIGESILHQAYAKCAIIAWDGVDESDILEGEIEDGKEYPALPFSAENCIALFKAQPDLFAELRAIADNAAYYRQSALEGDLGN